MLSSLGTPVPARLRVADASRWARAITASADRGPATYSTDREHRAEWLEG